MLGTLRGVWRRWAPALLASGLAASLGACTQTRSFVHDQVPERPAGSVEILLLEPDVQLAEISLGGIAFPKADWTEKGRQNVNAALAQIMAERDARLLVFNPPPDAPPEHPYNQILRLHEAVGSEILSHKYSGNALYSLPTKKDKFDWTLGPEVQQLRADYAADYALFVYFRDSFSSDGRKVMMVIMGALFAAVPPGGYQIGYASLVDLATGDILWFNVLFSEVGDLRDAESAHSSIEELLDQLPL